MFVIVMGSVALMRQEMCGLVCTATPATVRLYGMFTMPDGEIESVTLVRLHPIERNPS